MKKEMQQDPNAIFFVASDSPAEEERMRKEFPDRIRVHRKRSYDRNNPVAVQDALIDLYCLAKCRKLIGSYDSSFSEMAWKIRGIEKKYKYGSMSSGCHSGEERKEKTILTD
jgi:hypothetical protein